MKIIDITMWMGEWNYPGDKPLTIEGPYSVLGPDKEFVFNFSTNSADGTHIQAPHYMLKDGKNINDFDISYFRREAIVIDLGEFPKDELDNYDLKDKAIIFRTGIMDRLIKRENVKDPLLSLENAQYLIDKGIKMIVTDTTCLDDPLHNNGECPTTRLCCQNDVVLVKQVCHLDQITQKNVIVEAFPLKIKNISGTPCRALVIEDP